MPRLIIILAVIGLGLLLWHKIRQTKGEERKKLIVWSIALAAIAVLGVLAVTGHLNLITALIGGVIALLPKIINLLRYLPLFNRVRQHYQQSGKQHSQQGNGQQTSAKRDSMSREHAAEILGIKPNASKEEIITAHRRMMQKVHPDRGGSDYLAAQINQAKDVLLG